MAIATVNPTTGVIKREFATIDAGVLRNASNVPQSALYLDDLFRRGGFPAGTLQTLLIGSGTVDAVIRDTRVQGFALTPSEPVGRSVAATAGSQIKRLVLELGGSDPFIVHAEVDDAISQGATARTGGISPSDGTGWFYPPITPEGVDETMHLVEEPFGPVVVLYRAAAAVVINRMTISYPEPPFGGIKNSGFGRELGAPGIREFCNLKTVWKA